MYTNTDKNLKITSEIKMGENSKQVNSDAGSIFVSKTISNILSEVSRIHDFSKKSSKLDFHVHSLDEEMRKIDAFKRELPHCMHLLKDAIEALEKERLELKEREKGAVMEEFISLKSDFEEGRAKSSNETSEEKNWMSTVKLWMTPVQYENNFTNKNHNSFLSSKSFEEGEGSGSENQFSMKNRGGAFVPFKRASIKEDKIRGVEVHDLSLSINHVAEVEPEPESEPVEDLCVKEAPAFIRPPLHQPHHQEQQRKQRRCWSPELHKRFVDALVQLGGPQTATPKQIRELMKVDGLTNDEVKSHLQKYRLHVRKLPSSSAGVFSWYRQDGELSKQMAGHSGSPQDHLQLRGSAKRGGDSMEEDEDLKSESHSWKGRLHGAPRLGG